jgi:hypothetical protein
MRQVAAFIAYTAFCLGLALLRIGYSSAEDRQEAAPGAKMGLSPTSLKVTRPGRSSCEKGLSGQFQEVALAALDKRYGPLADWQRVGYEQGILHGETSRNGGLSDDPFRRCAQKILRGDFDPVPAWKVAIYREALERGVTVHGVAKRTTFCPSCSSGSFADGSRPRRGCCAAPKKLPFGTWVWIATDGLLKVTSRGGAVQWAPSKYLRGEEELVIDVWVQKCEKGCWTGPGTKRAVPWALVKLGTKP